MMLCEISRIFMSIYFEFEENREICASYEFKSCVKPNDREELINLIMCRNFIFVETLDCEIQIVSAL